MDLNEALSGLEKYDGKYRREQVDFALQHQEEITPCLEKILQNLLENPQAFVDRDDYFGHIYAFMLSGYFQDTSAHELIIEIFSMPEELVDQLFVDIGSEYLPIILYRTCGGSIETIQALTLNLDASDSARIAAIDALAYAVVDGIAERKETLKFLTQLLTVKAKDQLFFTSLAACSICDLCPDEETLKIIDKAYDDGLIYSGIVGHDEFIESMELGVDKCLSSVRQEMNSSMPTNFHKIMSGWACFHEK
jgi:hypothetical protein